MKEDEGRRIAVVEAFSLVEKRIQELNNQLTEANRQRKSVAAALHGVEKQAETQRKQLRQTKDQLSAAKEHIGTLKKELEKAEKAVEKAKQDGYDIGVAKTEEFLRAEVSGVCRTYCLQVWNKALNQVGVEAFSALRRVENIYYPPTIQASGPSSSKAKAAPKGPDPSKDVPAKSLPSSNSPSKKVEQVRAAEKENDTTKRVVSEATKPLATPKDPSKDKKVSQSLEIVLATLPIPTKEDPKCKGLTSTTATTAKPTKATAKDNPPLKIKQCLSQILQRDFFLFLFCNCCLHFEVVLILPFSRLYLMKNISFFCVLLCLCKITYDFYSTIYLIDISMSIVCTSNSITATFYAANSVPD